MKDKRSNQVPVVRSQSELMAGMVPVVQLIDPRLIGGVGAAEELRTVVTVADLVRYLKSRWKLSLLVAGLFSFAVFALLAGKVQQYEAEARVLVKMQGTKVFNFDRVVDNHIPEFSAPALLNNHRAEMGSQKFREFMAQRTGVELKERFVSPEGIEVPPLARLVGGVKALLGRGGGELFVAGDEGEALDGAFTGRLFTAVNIDMVKETHILRVLVRHESPDVAAEVANLYAQTYTDYVSVQDSEMTQKAREFLTEQAEGLRKRVEASERELLEYRQREGLLESDELLGMSADRRKLLNQAISEAKIELAALNQSLLQVRRLRGMRPEDLAVRAITAYPGVEELHTQIVTKLREKALLDARYKERHPKAIAFAREFEALTTAFADQVTRASSELENSTRALEARIVDLSGQLGEAEGEVLAMGDKNIQQTMLRSQLAADRSLYDKMVVRLNEASVSSQLKDASHLRLSEKATAAEKAVSPNLPMATVLSGILFFGVFIGLPVVLGMGGDLLRHGRIGEPGAGDREKAAGAIGDSGVQPAMLGAGGRVATLGMVPEFDHPSGGARELFEKNRLSGEFDSLATEIESRVTGRPKGAVYLVTSERAGCGKSTVAAGLGLAFGQQGKKTLVIDANLRAPAMADLFGMEGAQGLAPWLSCDGATSFDVEGLRQEETSLYVLPAGVSDEAPGSLLAKECFARLMAGAMESFDRVIVDASAAEGCPELFALLPHVGGVIAVSDRVGGQAVSEVEGLASRLGLGEDRLLGVVENRAVRFAAAAA